MQTGLTETGDTDEYERVDTTGEDTANEVDTTVYHYSRMSQHIDSSELSLTAAPHVTQLTHEYGLHRAISFHPHPADGLGAMQPSESHAPPVAVTLDGWGTLTRQDIRHLFSQLRWEFHIGATDGTTTVAGRQSLAVTDGTAGFATLLANTEQFIPSAAVRPPYATVVAPCAASGIWRAMLAGKAGWGKLRNATLSLILARTELPTLEWALGDLRARYEQSGSEATVPPLPDPTPLAELTASDAIAHPQTTVRPTVAVEKGATESCHPTHYDLVVPNPYYRSPDELFAALESPSDTVPPRGLPYREMCRAVAGCNELRGRVTTPPGGQASEGGRETGAPRTTTYEITHLRLTEFAGAGPMNVDLALQPTER